VLADQSLLNFEGALRINLLLSAWMSIGSGFPQFFTLANRRVCRGAALGTRRLRTRGGMGCRLRARRGLAVGLSVLSGRNRRQERDADDCRKPHS
jgi:hypothetical protein